MHRYWALEYFVTLLLHHPGLLVRSMPRKTSKRIVGVGTDALSVRRITSYAQHARGSTTHTREVQSI